MKNCVQCNHRFTFYDRLKTLFNLKGYLKCPKCNSVYKPISNIYRAIYYFLVFFISPMIIFNNLTLSNSMLRFILYMLFFIIYINKKLKLLNIYSVIVIPITTIPTKHTVASAIGIVPKISAYIGIPTIAAIKTENGFSRPI